MTKRMTCVFDFDVKSLDTNPHRVHTPFGHAVIVSDSDLAAEVDAKDAAIAALEGKAAGKDASILHNACQAAAFKHRAERAEAVVEAAEWCLPLAKGYAAAHPVGSNAKYAAELETRLAVINDQPSEASDE